MMSCLQGRTRMTLSLPVCRMMSCLQGRTRMTLSPPVCRMMSYLPQKNKDDTVFTGVQEDGIHADAGNNKDDTVSTAKAEEARAKAKAYAELEADYKHHLAEVREWRAKEEEKNKDDTVFTGVQEDGIHADAGNNKDDTVSTAKAEEA